MASPQKHWNTASDAIVREHLGTELLRVQSAGTPVEILGPEVTAEDVRKHFLVLAKLYHPHRFARRPEDIRVSANELFLRFKEAYESVKRISVAEPAAEKDNRESDLTRVATPPAPAPSAARKTESVETNQTRKELQDRRRNALSNRLARTTSPPVIKRSAQIHAVSASTEDTTQDNIKLEEVRFSEGQELMGRGEYKGAAEIFRELASKRPKEKRFRLHMHYAQGRIQQSAKNYSEARSEYKRALGLDTSFDPAHKAMSSLPTDKKKKGIFSKLFGK